MTKEEALSYFQESIEKGLMEKEQAFSNYVSWLKRENSFDIDFIDSYKIEFGFKENTQNIVEPDFNQWDLSTDRDSDFKVGISNGWVEEKFINELLASSRQIRFNGNMGYSEDVTSDIFRSAIQILGRINCPFDWETTTEDSHPYWLKDTNNYYSNQKGLVYGQVQSGKTASMLMLTQLALESGYNLIIHLSSDKESLRKQTQNRLNGLFEINGCHSSKFALWSPTQAGDYLDALDRNENSAVKFEDFRSKRVVICIKKNINHLRQLYNDLDSLKQNFDFGGSFNDFVNCLLVDDEADYASQNTSKEDRTAINDILTNLRKLISKNAYVGYTATPQACFGASEEALVGYPSDFVYPLMPYTKNGKTTYTGARDFFLSRHTNLIIRDISADAWPFWNKESGRTNGIYDPSSGNLVNDRLNRLIEERLDSIKDKGDNNETSSLIINGLKTFIVSTAVRWHRHAQIEKINLKDLTKEKVATRNLSGSNKTIHNTKQFPDTAMMFNVVLEKRLQIVFRDYIQELLAYILKNTEELGTRFFAPEYEFQRKKTEEMIRSEIPDLDELDLFITIALEIAMKDGIQHDNSQQVYLLNSSDEGSQLDYSNTQSNFYPKCASIFVGGLMLGRGITVEGLNTSVFLRSQSASMSDTNLQMCRWFGHKRDYFDLCSLYIQEHNFDLFREITICDERSREGIIQDLLNRVTDSRTINALFSSELFRLTSPNKSRALVTVNGNTLSNKSIKLNRCKVGDDWMDRTTNVINYLNELVNAGAQPHSSHDRAFTLKNIEFGDLRRMAEFWKMSEFEYDQFIAFLAHVKNHMDNGFLVPISLGLFGVSFIDGQFQLGSKEAKRGIAENGETKLLKRKYDNTNKFLPTYEGGSSPKSHYAGDKFIDLSGEKHVKILDDGEKVRDLLNNGILINLYFLDANYLGKQGDLNPGAKGFSRNGIIAAILYSCIGGATEPLAIQIDRLKEFFDNESSD